MSRPFASIASLVLAGACGFASAQPIADNATRFGSNRSLGEEQRVSRQRSAAARAFGGGAALPPALLSRAFRESFGAGQDFSDLGGTSSAALSFNNAGVGITINTGDLVAELGFSNAFLRRTNRYVLTGFGGDVRGAYSGVGSAVPFVSTGSVRTNGLFPAGNRYGHAFGESYIGPIDGQLLLPPIVVIEAQGVPAEPVPAPRELTLAEKVEVLVQSDAAGEADELLEAHLNEGNEEDATATRMLGLLRMAQGSIREGCVLVERAYRLDPGLARDEAWVPVRSGSERRRLVGRVVRWGHDEESGQAWLAVMVLMQADGKVDGARRMLDRAEEAGLEAGVVDAFREALAPVAQPS